MYTVLPAESLPVPKYLFQILIRACAYYSDFQEKKLL